MPGWHNAPVPSSGPPIARLLIVGLAPGLKGANRTGLPFIGDDAGKLLFDTLLHFGFAEFDRSTLRNCRITNAMRCVPPANKPTQAEIGSCRPFLAATIAAMPDLRAILALGRIAHDSTLRALDRRLATHPFSEAQRAYLFGEKRCEPK